MVKSIEILRSRERKRDTEESGGKVSENPRVLSTRARFQPTITMTRVACPNCGLVFQDSSAVLKHMNHRYSSCHIWFSNQPPRSPSPAPSSTHESEPSGLTSHFFPNAGHVFDSGPGFLGWFRGDEDAEARSADPYYPFFSKGEWEIASFLSRSGLSMKSIDEFLSLTLVRWLVETSITCN